MKISKLRFCLSIGILILMTLVLGACISTSSEPDIVGTRVLSPVADSDTDSSGVSVFTDSEDGPTLYQANCVQCHAETGEGNQTIAADFSCEIPDFTQRPDSVTIDQLIRSITNGTRQPIDPTCPMPPWGNRLTETQIQNVAQYVYDFAGGGEVVADNSPQETEEPVDVNPSVDDTPAVETTEEPIGDTEAETLIPTTLPVEIEMFTINGTIINGTADAAIPDELSVELIILGEDPDGGQESEPLEVYSDEVQIEAGGSFTFRDIPHEGLVLSIQTRYGGVVQRAAPVIVSGISENIDDFELTIYEVTDDSSGVHILAAESFVGAVTAEGLAEIIQYITFSNIGDQIFYRADGYSTEILIPPGTINAEMIAFTPIFNEFIESSPERFLRVESENGIVFRDTQPLFPGNSGDQIVGIYTIPYSGRMSVTQQFFYTVDTLIVNTSQSLDLQLESDQLTPSGTQTFQGGPYNSFVANVPFPVNTDLVYRITDGPNSGATATLDTSNPTTNNEESFLQDNSTFILSLGVLLIVAGSIYLFYDLQKTRILSQSGGSSGSSIHQSEDDLINAIAELDETFEGGELNEDDYERQRAKLKAKLVKIRLDE
jgi:mono/diheme cytochrome c family protein